METPFGLILAGGLATRMGGGQKALLSLNGETLLARAIRRLGPQVTSLAINANAERVAYEAFGHPVLNDTMPGHLGPLAGVLTGLRWAGETGGDHLLTVAGDSPFFPSDLGARLAEAATPATPIAMAAGPGGRHPTFALWPVSLADDLEAALAAGIRKIVAWTDAKGTARVEWPSEPFDPFFNVNTPDDMREAETLAKAHGF